MWALLPVKRLEGAKARLASMLSDAERATLARTMLFDVLEALEGSARISGIAVVTGDDDVAHLAAARGHRVIPDPGQGGLNGALSHAARQLSADGAKGVLIVHGDAPAITAREVDEIIDAQTTPPFVTIAAAAADGGTNGMAIAPPLAIHFAYGKASAARHRQAAEDADIPVKTLTLRGIGLDIDDADDLRKFVKLHPPGHTMDYLLESGIAERVQEA